jgi:hypothetical protein
MRALNLLHFDGMETFSSAVFGLTPYRPTPMNWIERRFAGYSTDAS